MRGVGGGVEGVDMACHSTVTLLLNEFEVSLCVCLELALSM